VVCLAVTDDSAAGRRSANSTDQGLRRRLGHTIDFQIGDLTGTLTTAISGHDTTATSFHLRVGRHGSTLAGLTDALGTAACLAWRHGAPRAEITDAWQQTRFAPHGATDDPEIPDTSSLADYVARRLHLDHPPAGISTAAIAVDSGQIAR
jgi:hypothetical protein